MSLGVSLGGLFDSRFQRHRVCWRVYLRAVFSVIVSVWRVCWQVRWGPLPFVFLDHALPSLIRSEYGRCSDRPPGASASKVILSQLQYPVWLSGSTRSPSPTRKDFSRSRLRDDSVAKGISHVIGFPSPPVILCGEIALKDCHRQTFRVLRDFPSVGFASTGFHRPPWQARKRVNRRRENKSEQGNC